jgi:hypothetical protein
MTSRILSIVIVVAATVCSLSFAWFVFLPALKLLGGVGPDGWITWRAAIILAILTLASQAAGWIIGHFKGKRDYALAVADLRQEALLQSHASGSLH